MSAFCHKQTYAMQNGMSALPPMRHRLRFSARLLWAKSGHHASLGDVRFAVFLKLSYQKVGSVCLGRPFGPLPCRNDRIELAGARQEQAVRKRMVV